MMRSAYERIRSALSFIPVGGHDERVEVAFMLKSELGEEGRELWDEWRGERGGDEAASVWRSARPNGPLTVATLFYRARAAGWRDDEQHLEPPGDRTRATVERQAREQAEIRRERSDTAEKAAAIVEAASAAAPDHAYLARKRIPPATLLEIGASAAAAVLGYPPKSGGQPLAGRLLVVPVTQGDRLATVELIDETGRKTALRGRGTKAGGLWATAPLPDGDSAAGLLIGEGVATVLSAATATGRPGVAALSSGNLPAVARALRERYPAAELVVLADLVKATGEPDRHAIEAARDVGGRLAVPDFGPGRLADQTDFNDLAAALGAEAVREAVERARAPAGAGPDIFPGEQGRPCYVALDEPAKWRGRDVAPGVYYCGRDEDRNGNVTITESWFCSPLHVEAVTHDAAGGNFGRLLRFRTTVGRWREWSMPMELLRADGAELRGELLSMGAELDPFKARAHLPAYLQREHPERRMLCALQVGWAGNSFVLPDAAIGPDAAGVIFQSGERGHEEFTTAGTLDGWLAEVAGRAIGNPLLLLALSAGFAGPMLRLCHAESGGIHFVGDSSTGKTTAIEAACSVWGGPNYRRSWRTTANGLEGAAAMFNDCLLALDEISECHPSEVGGIVYALGNGRGKQRASRTGAARSVVRWRCLVLSSGERTIQTHMLDAGHRAKAGQTVRLLDVPAARAFGAWDELHGATSAATFSDEIKRAAATHYGHAGRAFLEKLTRDSRDFSAYLEKAKSLSPFTAEGGEGQHKRAAARFALIGLAGELATEYGLTGWPEGDALRAAAEGFRLWRELRGQGNDERRQILRQVSAFIDRHGDGRFSDASTLSEGPVVRDRAGWWRSSGDSREYLFTSEGMREALKGFDFQRALDVLQEAGAIPAPGANGKRARPLRVLGRVVKVYPINADNLDGGHA